jgi:hypothetical protein
MEHEFKPSECPPTFRLHADFPQGVLPEVFGIITVADPREFSRESGLPGLILGDALQIKGWPHYPAEVRVASLKRTPKRTPPDRPVSSIAS